MSEIIDLTGHQFGKLTVIEKAENLRNRSAWKCRCECGNEKIVVTSDLKSGNTKSCGCIQKEFAKNLKYEHGLHDTRLNRIWKAMRQRCSNPRSSAFHIYGAEGKTVCDEWQTFKPFYDWAMSHGYKDGLTIERIDSTKGYSPDNCKWATYKEQCNNTRRNHFITYNGKKQTVAQWADEYVIKYKKLYDRLFKLKWDIGKALTIK